MAYTYILYSEKLAKFYIGASNSSLEQRLANHKNKKYGTHRFTARADDWELFLKIEAKDYAHAVRMECKIKSMKSSMYIRNLMKYPELKEKLIQKTKST